MGGSGEQSFLCGVNTAPTDGNKYDQSIVGVASYLRLDLLPSIIAWGRTSHAYNILYAKISPPALVGLTLSYTHLHIGVLPSCWQTCVEAQCCSDLAAIISSPRKCEDV